MTPSSRSLAAAAATLGLCLATGSLSAQSPIPFQVTVNDGAMTLYGYSQDTERLVCKDANGALGWFDAGVSGFGTMAAGTISQTIHNAIWRRGAGPQTEVFVARNFINTIQVPRPALYRAFTTTQGFLPASSNNPTQIVQDELSTNTADRWTLDAVNAANNVFFLREETGFSLYGVYRKEPAQYLSFPGARLLTSTPATGPLTLSPDDTRVAFPYGSTIAFCNAGNPSSNPPAATVFALPAGKVLSEPLWIDNQRLVAVMSPFSGAPGQIVLLDRTQAANPNAILPLTGANAGGVAVPFCKSLTLSGNRRWLAFAVQRFVGGTSETCAAVMNLADLNTGTAPAPLQPGGAFVTLMPLEDWNLTGLRVQQTNVTPTSESARVMFRGWPLGSTPPTLHTATLVRDFTVAGRATAAGATLDFRARTGQQDVIVGLFGSLARQSAPQAFGLLIGTSNPADVVSLATAVCTPSSPFSLQIPLAPTTATLGFSLFYQAGWLNGVSGAIEAGRVTELPLFN